MNLPGRSESASSILTNVLADENSRWRPLPSQEIHRPPAVQPMLRHEHRLCQEVAVRRVGESHTRPSPAMRQNPAPAETGRVLPPTSSACLRNSVWRSLYS